MGDGISAVETLNKIYDKFDTGINSVNEKMDKGFAAVHEKIDSNVKDAYTRQEKCMGRFSEIEREIAIKRTSNGIDRAYHEEEKRQQEKKRDYWGFFFRALLIGMVPAFIALMVYLWKISVFLHTLK